jgi:hypothetical protein
MKFSAVLQIIFLVVVIAVFAPSVSLAQSGEIEFHVYDGAGRLLNWQGFRRLQENGQGNKGDNDKLLDPDYLTVIIRGKDCYGLYSSQKEPATKDGQPVLEWPRGKTRVTLSLAWPTVAGYSNLMLDLPKPGSPTPPAYPGSTLPIYSAQGERSVVIFNLFAAQQLVDDLERSLVRRSQPPFSFPYVPSADYRAAYTAAYESAKENLRLAKRDGLSEVERAVLGEKAFQSASTATLLMLEDYGIQYAIARRPGFRPKWGVTFEIGEHDPPLQESSFDSVRELVDCDVGDGWVRLILSRDEGFNLADYQRAIKWAHNHKLKVLGELLDSYDMKSVNKEQWEAHVRKYVDVLSDNPGDREKEVDQWEVGNEVNGEWLVKKPDDKDNCIGYATKADFIAFAAHYIKTRTKKPTLLTLYWQIGENKSASAMFNWLKDRLVTTKSPDGRSVLEYLDDIGLSLYPDKNPMGTAFDRVLSTLREKYFKLPQHRLMITELDYWPPLQAEPAYEHVWFWGDHELFPSSPPAEFQKVRASVARFYQSGILGYPYSNGGTFWWYYLQEAAPDANYRNNEVWNALHTVHTLVTGATVACGPRR